MTAMQKLRILEDIDEKYIMEARPRRLLKYGETKTQRFDPEDNSVLMVLETVLSVASIALIVGAVFVWTLVGKDLLRVENSGDSESSVSKQENVTSEQENDDKPISAYSEGLEFKLNEKNDGYMVMGIGECKDTVINIPPTYNGKPVTEIGMNAFYYCKKIIEVNIPDSVEDIGIGAFLYCPKLEKVELPSELKVIWDKTFANCESLETIVLPGSVTEICVEAFAHCSSLKEITIPGSVGTVGWSAFYGCISLEKLTINEGVEIIAPKAFAYCTKLENFVIPESVVHIEYEAFYRCESLTDMTIPKGVKYLGNNVFGSCYNLTIVVINAEVKEINRLFVNDHRIESIVLGEGIEVVGELAITYFENLKQIVLPRSIVHIRDYNFIDCGDAQITYNGTVAEWEAITKEYGKLEKPITVHCIDGDCIDGPVPINN